MKRIVALFLAVMLVCTAALAGCSKKDASDDMTAAGTVLGGSRVEAKVGDEVTVPVDLRGLEAVAEYGNGTLVGFQFYFEFDPSVVSIAGAEVPMKGKDAQTNWSLDYSSVSDEKGMIMIVENNLIGVESKGGLTLAELKFKVLDGASGDIEIKYELVSICDSEANSAMTEHITVSPSFITVK